MSDSPRIFISYSHLDSQHKDELLKRLKIISRQLEINHWHDGKLLAGDKFDPKIRAQLDAADVVCLLISPDFIVSDYCYQKEMMQAMENAEQRGTRVIAIIVRETPDWHEYLFGSLLALPDNGKPLEDWPSPDKFWAQVQIGLRDAIKAGQAAAKKPVMEAPSIQPPFAEQPAVVILTPAGAQPLPAKPDWASRIDRDRDGLYASFIYKGITQCLRWINPGTFLMGSPEHEAERYDNETLHEVTLSQGFWLADTACTQGLWESVMDANPSVSRRGLAYPVNSVSWDDVQVFMQRLNNGLPGLAVRLPTEAEWEYACRAGTLTPFSFGENITPEQVNYNSGYPYAGGKQSAYRGETVKVLALRKNGWGLYQMHGNVWEWCADWYDAYPVGQVIDPRGSASGIDRVMRGGSWSCFGGAVE